MDATPVEHLTSPAGPGFAETLSPIPDPTPDSLPDPPPEHVPGPWLRLFNRIFSRHMMNSALLLLIVMLMAGNMHIPREMLRDPDLWWHLADARILWTTHHFIHVEPYSFSVAGKPWIDPEWLAEMPYWIAYHTLGLMGIYVMTSLILCANILFAYWRGYWNSGHAGAAFWAAGIGFMPMTINAGARTIIVAYLLLAAELAIFEASQRGNKRILWLLPPLFCVWVNTHGSWIIGLGMFVLYILCGLFSFKEGAFDQDAFSKEDRNRLLLVLLVSVAVLIINPYGWRMDWNPIDMMVNQKLNIANVQEWQPLNLEWFAGKGCVAIMAIMVIANLLRGRKWKIYELAFVFFAFYAAFLHARFAFLAAVITAPLLAVDINHGFLTESDKKTIPVMNLIMITGSISLIIYFSPSPAKLNEGLTTVFPLKLIDSVQPSWRTMNGDGLGGMMDFRHKPTFLDSRFDTFEHHGVLKDFLDIVRIKAPLELLDKYNIDHVLIQQENPLSYLLERTPGWTVIDREGKGGDRYDLIARTPGSPPTIKPGEHGTIPAD